jgi:acetyl-CoA carboxylase biotin carboxyl carrier protein
VPLTDEDVREILRIIDGSDLKELRIATPAFSLYVCKGAEPRFGAGGATRPVGAAPDAPADAPPAAATAAGDTVVEAPMLGTFFRASSPSDPPFVEVGDHVEPDTVVCLIEVMKLMNHITAGVAGVVVEVLAENSKLVEFDQPLFRLASDP